jgi:hypothetical protein
VLAEKGTRSTKNAFLFIQLNQSKSKSKRRSCIRENKINPIDYFLSILSDKNRNLFSLSFCLDATASSAQVQKNEKIKSRLKPFGENLSATDTRKECTLWRTNVKRFSVSVPPLNFLLPHFANRAPDSTKPLSLFIKFQFFLAWKGPIFRTKTLSLTICNEPRIYKVF